VEGVLIKRYKRFFADVRPLDPALGDVVVAHCANTGSMKTCGEPGDRVYLSPAASPERKLRWTWELTGVDGGFVGVNTARPNHVVHESVARGAVAELAGYTSWRAEVAYGKKSRIDLLLEGSAKDPRRCWVEVKNATLRHGDHVVFPDAVTERGLKHLGELSAMVRAGDRAVMFFFVNRPDGRAMAPAEAIDPDYAAGLRAAQRAGVEILAYRARTSLAGMTVGERIPVEL
jgi:sugar fermentation stimulation protein A